MQNKSKKQKIVFMLFAAVFAVVSFYTVLSVAPSLLQAQSFDNEKRAKEDAAKNDVSRTDKYNKMKDFDIVALAFPNTQKGCINKASMFLAAAKSYQKGDSLDDILPMKAFRPVFEGFYETLRSEDPGEAAVNNYDEFQNCLRTAGSEGDSERTKIAQTKLSSCKRLGDMIFDILDSIKRRKNATSVLKKYEGRPLDLKGTNFEKMDDPATFFVGQLYGKAQGGSYDDAAELGATLSLSCYM